MPSSLVSPHTDNLAHRLWRYMQERFPIFEHGALIAAFSFSGVALSACLRGSNELPHLEVLLTALLAALIFFLQLRIADEIKDHEEDCRFRPYRPVPRGLVSLSELKGVAVVGALLQFILTLLLNPFVLWFLLLAWLYLGLMTKEFFQGKWLRAHHLLYMGSHMLIMPFIDAYITACDWAPAAHGPPDGLLWFLLVSFFNGLVIEIGRKIRAPQDEEVGVETYTVLWGMSRSIWAWLCMLAATALFALFCAQSTGLDRKSTRLNSSHLKLSRMPSSA